MTTQDTETPDIPWDQFTIPWIEPQQFKGRGGRVMSYVDARQVAARLDALVGPAGWSTAFQVLDPGACVVQCTLTIAGVSKSDVGYPNNPGTDTEEEPYKSSYSDSLKRAAVQWGIGRWLYDLPTSPAHGGAPRESPEIGTAAGTHLERRMPLPPHDRQSQHHPDQHQPSAQP